MKKTLLALIISMGYFLPDLQAQVLALVAFFNSTNGPNGNWYNFYSGAPTSWLKRPVKEWYGITLKGNRVTGIHLRTNFCITNLIGDIPPQIADLTELETFILQKAYIGKLPKEMAMMSKLKTISIWEKGSSGPTILPVQLAGMPALTTLNVPFATALFDQLEPLIGISQLTYPSLIDLTAPSLTHRLPRGGGMTLYSSVPGTANKYQWLFNGVAMPGANQSSYTLTKASDVHYGEYTCEVTNTLLRVYS